MREDPKTIKVAELSPSIAGAAELGGINLNPRSSTWRFLENHLSARVGELYKEIACPSLGERETAILRGRLAEIEDTLDLAVEKPGPEAELTEEPHGYGKY